MYTYNFWNFTKCSIGNVYVPHSGHNLHARAARIEILSWLNSHSSHPSMLVGDFNLPTEKLGNLLSRFSNWKILPLWSSSISWTRGNREYDIDHAIVNDHMLDLLSYGTFIDFPPHFRS